MKAETCQRTYAMNILKNVSVIVTVKNEAKTIRELLESLLHQTSQPHEIIIVDGGSSDSTIQIINEYAERNPLIRLIVSPGSNRAQGRNIGVRNASTECIVCTDAGVRLDEHWLENLVKRFDGGTKVVSGNYLPECNNLFHECVSELILPKIEELNDDFLPSSRSVAFKKTAWEAVGGYPEHMELIEDTGFDLNLQKKGFRFAIAKDAIAYWKLRSNLSSFFVQYFNYAYRETKSGLIFQVERYRSHQVSNTARRYSKVMRSIYRKTRKAYSFILVSLLMFTFISSLFSGFLVGIIGLTVERMRPKSRRH